MGKLATGAGEGNRTLVISLENFCSTIELHPHTSIPQLQHKITLQPSQRLTLLNLVEGEGFEPSYSKRADLQSAALGHPSKNEPAIIRVT